MVSLVLLISDLSLPIKVLMSSNVAWTSIAAAHSSPEESHRIRGFAAPLVCVLLIIRRASRSVFLAHNMGAGEKAFAFFAVLQ